jgi:hypothetical protein
MRFRKTFSKRAVAELHEDMCPRRLQRKGASHSLCDAIQRPYDGLREPWKGPGSVTETHFGVAFMHEINLDAWHL